jgi:hypothetical protein
MIMCKKDLLNYLEVFRSTLVETKIYIVSVIELYTKVKPKILSALTPKVVKPTKF